nr:hypothetical protein [Clostridium aestuarii]
MKNKDFEYIKEGKINKVIIQNVRDKGFTFIVTDKSSIKELYDILSEAKEVENKITLESDYVLEFQESHHEVHKFNYIAGLDKTDAGNLYGDDKIYIVSKRLDDDIMKNFWNIRRPKEFKDVYYKSIIMALKEYRKSLNGNEKIGIDMDDQYASKFILTMDLEEFKEGLSSNEEIIRDDNTNKYDVIMNITTEGYKSEIYKCIITFYYKQDKKETKYYFTNKYDEDIGAWQFTLSVDKKPENF